MIRILVVDDEPDFRLILRSVLTAKGYESVLAANGEEALRKLEEGPVDFIISDIYMPVMDGIKFHRAVRATGKYQNLPFLFVSAFDDQHTLQAVKDPRYDGFVKKGSRVEEMTEWIEYLLTPEDRRPKLPPGGARSRVNEQIRTGRSTPPSRTS
ncbi:MAG: response regulator [Bacteroidota bacterium]